MESYSHFSHHITYCMYGSSHMKPTTLWTRGFTWKPRPKCGTRKRGTSRSRKRVWQCQALTRSGDTRHPQKVQDMNMEDKIQLPTALVVSLLDCAMNTPDNKVLMAQYQTSKPPWVLALFESFGSWHPACAKFNVWHVAISYVGVSHIDEGSKHVHIPMDLSRHTCLEDVLDAVYHFTGFLVPSRLVAVVASPPCTTFSRLDARWGHHRDHNQAHKPAVSKLAKQHDVMVLNLMKSLFPDIENPYHVEGECTIVNSQKSSGKRANGISQGG